MFFNHEPEIESRIELRDIIAFMILLAFSVNVYIYHIENEWPFFFYAEVGSCVLPVYRSIRNDKSLSINL